MNKEYRVSIYVEKEIIAEDAEEAREKFLDNLMIDEEIDVEELTLFDIDCEASPIVHYKYADKYRDFDFEADNKDEAIRILESKGDYNLDNLGVVKEDGQIIQVINLN